jgi:hypothetical protein
MTQCTGDIDIVKATKRRPTLSQQLRSMTNEQDANRDSPNPYKKIFTGEGKKRD